ncbi:MAG TPA: hypothetical protein VJN71_02615 [Nitrososphaerales archaeon]|nr:hypothetical protein [Nitrososphaerales archaeon]
MSETTKLEERISQLKQDLGKISEERWRAALSRNQNDHMNARIKAAEKTLENCDSLAKYVASFSTPLARQISRREEQARKTFEQVRRTRDPEVLQKWIKEDLIPSTRFAERLGHVAASARASETKSNIDFHRWSPK